MQVRANSFKSLTPLPPVGECDGHAYEDEIRALATWTSLGETLEWPTSVAPRAFRNLPQTHIGVAPYYYTLRSATDPNKNFGQQTLDGFVAAKKTGDIDVIGAGATRMLPRATYDDVSRSGSKVRKQFDDDVNTPGYCSNDSKILLLSTLRATPLATYVDKERQDRKLHVFTADSSFVLVEYIKDYVFTGNATSYKSVEAKIIAKLQVTALTQPSPLAAPLPPLPPHCCRPASSPTIPSSPTRRATCCSRRRSRSATRRRRRSSSPMASSCSASRATS